MGILRRSSLALVALVLLALVSVASPARVEATDHPPCEPLPGASQSSCVVVDGDTSIPGEQSEAYYHSGLSFEVAVVARLDPAVTDGIEGFQFFLSYDPSLAQAAVPEVGPSFLQPGFVCDAPPPTADYDGNPNTGDALVVCFITDPEIAPVVTGTQVLATIEFTVMETDPFTMPLSLSETGVWVQPIGGTLVVTCPVSDEPGGGCHGANVTREVPFDFDNDGVRDYDDNCVFRWNPGQEDLDGDRMGDECDPDIENDGVENQDDNCDYVVNPGQGNADGGTTDLDPWGKSYDDITWPMSDFNGDACDADDDNDGLSDTQESGGQPCATAAAATDPLLNDTDGDLVLDGAECALASDPTNAASKPPAIVAPDADNDGLPNALDPNDADTDSDDDRIPDGREFRYFNSNPASPASDFDLCDAGGGVTSTSFRDAREVASVNGDWKVSAIDLSQVSQHFSADSAPPYIPAFDMNRDGKISSIDLSFVAQQFGGCGSD